MDHETTENHPVLELIAARAAGAPARARAENGGHEDGHRLALVIEGGGMRGVVSAAMTAAIEELGLLDAFDLVVGASAGALNAAALLGGVADGCTYEYAEGFADRRFINPARLLLGRPAVDVGYVLDFNSDRLDADRHARTLQSDVELHCVATDVDASAASDLTDLRDLEELRSALLASSRLPWVGGEPVHFRGRRWLDGGLTAPIPLDAAFAAGATHALVLLTRPHGGEPDRGGGLGDRLVERRLRVLNPGLVDAYRRRPALYRETTARIARDERSYAIALPKGTPVPSRLDRDRERLTKAAELARDAARVILAQGVIR